MIQTLQEETGRILQSPSNPCFPLFSSSKPLLTTSPTVWKFTLTKLIEKSKPNLLQFPLMGSTIIRLSLPTFPLGYMLPCKFWIISVFLLVQTSLLLNNLVGVLLSLFSNLFFSFFSLSSIPTLSSQGPLLPKNSDDRDLIFASYAILGKVNHLKILVGFSNQSLD